jgi:hypothetical protein
MSFWGAGETQFSTLQHFAKSGVSMLSPVRVVLLASIFCCSTGWAKDPVVATFDDQARSRNWTVNFGHWEAKDGVLVCRQLEKDNHAAASRWQIPLSDGIVKFRLKLAGASAFHVGFDPAPGQLNKQGHLYSLVVTPTGASLRMHRDKAKSGSTDSILAEAKWPREEGWMEIELHSTDGTALARIKAGETNAELTGSDETFKVAKPAVVFRTIGGDALLDEVIVQVTKPGLLSAIRKPAEK